MGLGFDGSLFRRVLLHAKGGDVQLPCHLLRGQVEDCPGSLNVPVCDGQARRDRQRALRGKEGGSRCLQSINTNTGDLGKGALNVISTTFHIDGILKECPESLPLVVVFLPRDVKYNLLITLCIQNLSMKSYINI